MWFCLDRKVHQLRRRKISWATIVVPALYFIGLGVFVVLPPRTSFAKSPAKVLLYYYGGGGEREKEKNIFDSGFENIQQLSSEREWRRQFLVDTGHASTKEKIQGLSVVERKNVGDFSEKRFKESLKSLVSDVESGKVSKGRQILLVINTHGGERATDGQNAVRTSEDLVPITKILKDLIKAAQRKGVKLGLVLAGCYSGDLKRDFGVTEGVCVVAGSAERRVSSTDFQRFFSDMKDHENLESLFLSSRKMQVVSAGQPGINSEAGFLAERELEVFKNFKFHPLERVTTEADRLCSDNEAKLDRIVDLARKVADDEKIKWYEVWKNRDSDVATAMRDDFLGDGISYQVSARPEPGLYGVDGRSCIGNLEKITKESRSPDPLSLCWDLHLPKLYLSDLAMGLEILKRERLSALTPEKRKELGSKYKFDFGNYIPKLASQEWFEAEIARISRRFQEPEIRKGRRLIQQDQAALKWWEARRKSADEMAWSGKGVERERQLYDAFYRHYSKQNPKTNACREFKLK